MMRIIIGNNNQIEYSSVFLKRGTNVLGDVEGIVNPKTFELCPLENLESLNFQLTPSQIYTRAGIVALNKQDQFSWASPDFSAFRDIFYAKLPNQKFLLGDDFFDILSQLSFVTVKKPNIDFFIRHNSFPPGKTFFEEISRIKIGNKLKLINNKPIEESIWEIPEKEPKRDYQTFKKALSSVLSCLQISDNDGIFLSSGCDSGLLAALSVIKFSKHPSAITVHYRQAHYLNELDAKFVKNITDFLGLKHSMIDLDYNKESITPLKLFFKSTPLAAHVFIPYFKMAQEIAERKIERLWAGEYADRLYNLGVTGKTLGGIIGRFYLSKEYISSLSDIEDKVPIGFLYKMVGEMGNLAYRIKKGYHLKQPKTFQELSNAFEKSEELLALPFKNSNFKSKFSQPHLNSLEARKHMFERMVQSYIAGPEGRAIHAAAESHLLKPILPYSATNMIYFFRNLEMSCVDVLKPKKFIYRYLRELLGKNNYKRLYSFRTKYFFKTPKGFLTYEKWQKKFINETKFGIELKTAVKEMISSNTFLKEFKDFSDSNNVYYLIGIFWLGNVLKKARDLGVNVKI